MIDSYIEDMRALIGLAADTDRSLSAERAKGSRRRAELEGAHSARAERLARSSSELRQLLVVARDRGISPAQASEADSGSDPVAMLEQVVGRLSEALDAVAHTQAALAAEQEKARRERAKREEEFRLRREAEEAAMLAARARDRLLQGAGALACLVSAAAAAALSTPAALAVPAIALLALAWAASQQPSLLADRAARRFGGEPLPSVGRGRWRWLTTVASLPTLGSFGVLAFAVGDTAGGAVALAAAAIFGGACAWRARLKPNHKQETK